jgi:hypothetical protein
MHVKLGSSSQPATFQATHERLRPTVSSLINVADKWLKEVCVAVTEHILQHCSDSGCWEEGW